MVSHSFANVSMQVEANHPKNSCLLRCSLQSSSRLVNKSRTRTALAVLNLHSTTNAELPKC